MKQNKIILSTEKQVEGEIEQLIIDNEETILNIRRNTTIKDIIFKSIPFKTTWILNDNTTLNLKITKELKNINGTIKIISKENTNLEFFLGIKAKENNKLEIINEVEKNNNNSNIKIRVICEEKGCIELKTLGILKEKTKENNFQEDIKYLNEWPCNITCFPLLYVYSDDVVANHFMTVKNIEEEELFYLETKGISKERSKEIIRESFLNFK